jgi:hypothetical protein
MLVRTKLLTATTTAAAVSALIMACSSTLKSSDDAGTTTPVGATAVTNTGLTPCPGTSLEPGCFTTGNASYATPSVAATCGSPGGPAKGPADEHCKGMTPQVVGPTACSVADAGASINNGADGGDAAAADGGDAGAAPPPGACGENGPDYGATMYGTEGDDDDCKYHVTYTYTPICQSDGTYFVVNAHYLRDGAPLENACTYAELCWENGANGTGSPPPNVDQRPPLGNQTVVEGPPGTYTIGPVIFDESGEWTVRFHFNEICCDVLPDSPHGHAAFHIKVP